MIAGVLTLIGLVPVHAGTLEDGIAAFDKQDYATALKLLLPLAEQGNAVAQRDVGRIYFDGLVPGIKDQLRGVGWYAAAARQRDSEAEYYLGLTYLFGEGGLPQDNQHGIALIKSAANDGCAHCASSLGDYFRYGIHGLPKDAAQAFVWFRRAAELGDEFGQKAVGMAYMSGEGVQSDEAQAHRWLQIAFAQALDKAEHGDAIEQASLGMEYEFGSILVGAQDKATALMWYRRAAAHGLADDRFVKAAIMRLEK